MKDCNTTTGWRRLLYIIILATCYSPIHSFSNGVFCLKHKTTQMMIGQQQRCLQMSIQNEDDSDEIQKLKESASRLRQEAQDLESSLNKDKKNKPPPTAVTTTTDVSYTSIKDSKWILTYRFANDPIQDDENDQKPKQFFTGKVSVHFRSDGYTDILSSSPNNNNNAGGISFVKFWGWDEEISPEDGNTYLLFSADVQWSDDTKERFYFNAQIEKTTKNIVSLTDGKVTVKRELNPPGGRWGFFQTQGILAQFRYCGEFLCKPTSG